MWVSLSPPLSEEDELECRIERYWSFASGRYVSQLAMSPPPPPYLTLSMLHHTPPSIQYGQPHLSPVFSIARPCEASSHVTLSKTLTGPSDWKFRPNFHSVDSVAGCDEMDPKYR